MGSLHGATRTEVPQVCLPDSDQATFRIGAGQDLGLYVNTDDSAVIRQFTQDKDLFFYVNDGGQAVKAMQIDASNSGSLYLQNDLQYISIGAGLDGNIYVYNDDFYVSNFTAGKDTVFQYLEFHLFVLFPFYNCFYLSQ